MANHGFDLVGEHGATVVLRQDGSIFASGSHDGNLINTGGRFQAAEVTNIWLGGGSPLVVLQVEVHLKGLAASRIGGHHIFK